MSKAAYDAVCALQRALEDLNAVEEYLESAGAVGAVQEHQGGQEHTEGPEAIFTTVMERLISQEAEDMAARVLAFLRSQAAAEYRNVVLYSAASIKELESGGP